MKNSITLRHSILINRPREMVWDFTQDYHNRTTWDKAVLEATVLQPAPNRMVRLKLKGNTIMTFVYKLDDRPHKTTLAAKDVHSAIIESVGGSWTYTDQNGQTLWTQTNTIVLKNNFLLALLLPVFRFLFIRQTRQAMNKAKKILEGPLWN